MIGSGNSSLFQKGPGHKSDTLCYAYYDEHKKGPPKTLGRSLRKMSLFPAYLLPQTSSSAYMSTVYKHTYTMKKNTFKVPLGNEGKAFMSQLAWLFKAYGDQSTLECIAL